MAALAAMANLGAMLAEQPVYAKTALQMIQESPKPHFRQGHTLLPLTRWGWTMPFEVRVELADHWGYALEFGPDATPAVVKEVDDPQSIPARICALAAADPKRYPLCVLASRPLLDGKFLESLPAEAWCHDAQGKLSMAPQRHLSPEAPDEVFLKAGMLAAEPLAKIRRKAPIAMVLNGGEYGLNVLGFGGPTWEKDPKVLQAKGNKNWFRYISERKAHQELLISRAIRDAVPDRRLYIYYPTSACPHHGRTADWWRWTWDYPDMKPISDLPNISIYYKEFNSGWTGQYDMLTQALNAIGGDIAQGEPLSYNWLCGGWVQKDLGPEAFSDPEHYMGFLKCYYTAGMIGGVAGYFAYPPGGFAADLGEQMPSWLRQMLVLAHAHALFSHLEDLVRQGDLLPGPDQHRWVKDRPAYEFPTGDKDVRVVARRHKQRPEWLLTAWAAGGPHREVAVEIPELGTVKLLARACGTVYRASLAAGKLSLRWVDENGMCPTAAQQKRPGGSP
jgi:hypothetical protein